MNYFTEKSAARPNIVLRILLAHDFDEFLHPMVGHSLFMNNYGSVKIYEEEDIEIFRKRSNCKKISFISSVPNFESFQEFHGRIQSIAYLYEGYYGKFVMDDLLKVLKIHWKHLRRFDLVPYKVSSFVRI